MKIEHRVIGMLSDGTPVVSTRIDEGLWRTIPELWKKLLEEKYEAKKI